MTAYELASLHSQLGAQVNLMLQNFIAILSLYVGAGFLVAHRLKLASAIMVTLLFLVADGGSVPRIVGVLKSWVGVSGEIRALAAQGHGLAWHEAVFMAPWQLDNFPIGSAIILWGLLLGAICFFFAHRHSSLQSESATKAVSIPVPEKAA